MSDATGPQLPKTMTLQGGLRDGETIDVSPEHEKAGTEIFVGGELYVVTKDAKAPGGLTLVARELLDDDKNR